MYALVVERPGQAEVIARCHPDYGEAMESNVKDTVLLLKII